MSMLTPTRLNYPTNWLTDQPTTTRTNKETKESRQANRNIKKEEKEQTKIDTAKPKKGQINR